MNLQIDKSGDWLLGARRIESPNCDDRPQDALISLLLIHGISLPPGQFGTGCIERLFLNELDAHADPRLAALSSLKVSAHALIDRQGGISQFVAFGRRAWHAGESAFKGCANCNDYSIGIELEGTDDLPYADIQYQRLADTTDLLMERYPAIERERIVGHCDVAPKRKTDPGPAFDWEKYFSLCRRIEPG